MRYTDEELSMLSDEEREAVTATRDEEDAGATAGSEDQGKPAEATAEAGNEEVTAEAEPEPAAERDEEFIPQYTVNPVADFQEKMAALAGEKTALRAKLNGGDMSLDEYEAQKDAIVDQERELREQKLKADIAIERNEQTAKARWDWEQERFFDAKENAIYADKILNAALNTAVMDLANAPENADKKGSWILQEADKLVRARFAPAKVETPPDAKPKDSRKPDLSVVPKTLAHLPAADIPQTGDVDEFAHIDRLSGLELEKAVAKLSESERERYRAA